MLSDLRAIQGFLRAARRAPVSILRVSLALTVFMGLVAMVGCYGHNGYFVVVSGTQQENALWVANGTSVLEFLPSQQQAGTSDPAPHLTLSSSVFGAPQGVVFDGNGDLWVIDGGTVKTGGTVAPALYEFTAQQLSKLSTNNAPTPNVTIQSSSFVTPEEATFDRKGNLWVSDNGGNVVYAFTRSQLSATNTTATPMSVITSSTAFNGPIGIAFDGGGDLYVANNGGNTIYEFQASSLPNLTVSPGTTPSDNRTLTPNVTLSNSSGSIQSPWGLAFDANGNLWSSNAITAGTVVEFTRSQIAATGDPTPNITLSSVAVSSNQTLVSPYGIAFDPYDDLAVDSSAAPFGIAEYAQSQLLKSSATAPTPAAFLVGSSTTLSAPAGIAFGPVIE
jgi:sugar lactone lactonase YvrE